MSHLLSDYDFELPGELVARYPPAGRADARMMVVHRAERRIEHRAFADFPGFLRPAAGDLAVLNDARVVPARVWTDDGALELLVLSRQPAAAADGGGTGRDDAADADADVATDDDALVVWTCLVRPGRKARVGSALRVGGVPGTVARLGEDGERVIRFEREIDLAAAGTLPLPPYFRRDAEEIDRERYQTVFARPEAGAIAAPTAGLHFTPEILARVPHARVTLEVGVGTFRPVKVDDVRAHRMHAERYEIGPPAAAAINACRTAGGRLVAVGTTTVRVLEACARDPAGRVLAQRGQTDLFLYPPRPRWHVDALLTNFHLPRSTLLMLVSAFADRELVLTAYREAVRERYRFFSYGDCMLLI